MTAHRILWKLLAITATTSACALWLALVRLVGFAAPRTLVARENRIVRRWARCMTRILGMRVRVDGAKPSAPFLLVANHLSYVDVLAFMSEVDARLLSKADVRHWPVLGALAAFGGTLFVDRSRRTDLPRVILEIRQTLDRGRGVIFFPEGTSSAGLKVMPFKASLFEVAARGNLEVCTAAISYRCPETEPPAQWSVCWWGDMEFIPHFRDVLRLKSFEAHLKFNPEQLRSADRKELALAAETAVRRSFEPVCAELGPDPRTRDAAHSAS